MLLTILFAVVLVVSIIVYFVNEDTVMSEILFGSSLVFGFMSFMGLLISIISIMLVQIPKEINFEKTVMYKEMIEYRLELMENDEIETYAEIQLYNDIIEYNRFVMSHKKWSNNSWISWFYNKQIGDMELIVLER